MINVFVDTDVLLDVFLKRMPFKHDSELLFTLSDQGVIVISVSALSLMNAHYTLRKVVGREHASKYVSSILSIVRVLPLSEKQIRLALLTDFQDFEDSVQYKIAQADGIRTIITRNKRDFKLADLHILTPSEFLATLSIQ